MSLSSPQAYIIKHLGMQTAYTNIVKEWVGLRHYMNSRMVS